MARAPQLPTPDNVPAAATGLKLPPGSLEPAVQQTAQPSMQGPAPERRTGIPARPAAGTALGGAGSGAVDGSAQRCFGGTLHTTSASAGPAPTQRASRVSFGAADIVNLSPKVCSFCSRDRAYLAWLCMAVAFGGAQLHHALSHQSSVPMRRQLAHCLSHIYMHPALTDGWGTCAVCGIKP